MAGKFKIGGIKLSEKLVQVDFREPRNQASKLSELLGKISRAKVNVPHLHQGQVGQDMQTSFCILSEDFSRIKPMLADAIEAGFCRILPSVVTVSLYPHGASLGFVATVYAIFTNNNLPVHGISSSVSAFVIHTDYSDIEKAVAAILEMYELPANHSPLYPQLKMQQVER